MKETPQEKPAPLPSGEHPWARQLRRARKLASAAETAFSGTLTLALFLGLGEKCATSIMLHVQSPWLRALSFSAGLAMTYWLISLPLSFTRSFLIEKRFGLSTQTIPGWFSDQVKGVLIAAILGTIVILGLTGILVTTGQSWWLISALAGMLFGILISRIAPQWIIPLFFKMKPLASEEIQTRFKKLAEKNNTPVLGIYEINLSQRTKAANAAVMGFGASRRAVIGDTLLEEFTIDEAEFVLAHELAHHYYHDLWRGVAISGMTMLLSLSASHWIITHFDAFSVPFPPTNLNFNPIVLFWIAAFTSVCGFILGPIGKYFSRRAETRADEFAIRATANSSAGARAFRRLGYQNLAVFSPPIWEETLFYTHPAIARRIARLEEKRK